VAELVTGLGRRYRVIALRDVGDRPQSLYEIRRRVNVPQDRPPSPSPPANPPGRGLPQIPVHRPSNGKGRRAVLCQELEALVLGLMCRVDRDRDGRRRSRNPTDDALETPACQRGRQRVVALRNVRNGPDPLRAGVVAVNVPPSPVTVIVTPGLPLVSGLARSV